MSNEKRKSGVFGWIKKNAIPIAAIGGTAAVAFIIGKKFGTKVEITKVSLPENPIAEMLSKVELKTPINGTPVTEEMLRNSLEIVKKNKDDVMLISGEMLEGIVEDSVIGTLVATCASVSEESKYDILNKMGPATSAAFAEEIKKELILKPIDTLKIENAFTEVIEAFD